MDFSDIYNKIEEYRPLNLISSLPVLMEKDGKLEVVWFNFSFAKNGTEGTVTVYSIFDTLDSETINQEQVQLKERVFRSAQEEPLLEEEDYYEQLEKLYQNYNPQTMQALLAQAAFPPFLKTYETVKNYHLQQHSQENIPEPAPLLNSRSAE